MGIRLFIGGAVLLCPSLILSGPFGSPRMPRLPRRAEAKRTATKAPPLPPVFEAEGRVRRTAPGTLVVDANDTRILTLKLNDADAIDPGIREGALVHILASTDSSGNLTATRIERLTDDGAPGAAPNSFTMPAPVAASPGEDLLAHARQWVSKLSKQLPDYVCRQLTTRYVFESKESGWHALNVVSAELAYANGREDYRNIAIDGHKTGKKMPAISGMKSTGEYATALRDLFNEQTGARFEYRRESALNGAPAAVYNFAVSREHSDWRVFVGGQAIVPAFSGAVWIDPATARVLRIEMQADSIPAGFPLDRVEATVEYDRVGLGVNSYFLPVTAENLACHRGAILCDKNVVEFRNYKKFASESKLRLP